MLSIARATTAISRFFFIIASNNTYSKY